MFIYTMSTRPFTRGPAYFYRKSHMHYIIHHIPRPSPINCPPWSLYINNQYRYLSTDIPDMVKRIPLKCMQCGKKTLDFGRLTRLYPGSYKPAESKCNCNRCV